MGRGKPFKPINLVMACSGITLASATASWLAGGAIGSPFLHAAGTTLFSTGMFIAFLPLLGALIARGLKQGRSRSAENPDPPEDRER